MKFNGKNVWLMLGTVDLAIEESLYFKEPLEPLVAIKLKMSSSFKVIMSRRRS